MKNRDNNPFEGFIQVLLVAQASGRLSSVDYADIMKQIEVSQSIAMTYCISWDETKSQSSV